MPSKANVMGFVGGFLRISDVHVQRCYRQGESDQKLKGKHHSKLPSFYGVFSLWLYSLIPGGEGGRRVRA